MLSAPRTHEGSEAKMEHSTPVQKLRSSRYEMARVKDGVV